MKGFVFHVYWLRKFIPDAANGLKDGPSNISNSFSGAEVCKFNDSVSCFSFVENVVNSYSPFYTLKTTKDKSMKIDWNKRETQEY